MYVLITANNVRPEQLSLGKGTRNLGDGTNGTMVHVHMVHRVPCPLISGNPLLSGNILVKISNIFENIRFTPLEIRKSTFKKKNSKYFPYKMPVR